MKKEIWACVENTNGKYLVSTYGNVMSRRILKDGRVLIHKLKFCLDRNGYNRVDIVYDWQKKGKSQRIHKLVSNAFLEKEENTVIDHIDGDKLNNNIMNLQRITNRRNVSKSRPTKKGLPTGLAPILRVKKGLIYAVKFIHSGKQVYLGQYNTIKEASQAYQVAVKNLES